MRLSQRIKRHLVPDTSPPPPPDDDRPADSRTAPVDDTDSSRDLIRRLRRQITRLERTAHVTDNTAKSSPERPVVAAVERSCQQSTPTAAKPLLQQQAYGVDEQHGAARLAPPRVSDLAGVRQLLAFESQSVAHGSLHPTDLLFIDTETTGLSRGAGTIAFVIGLGGFWGHGGTFRIDQIVLHDPAREAEGLQLLASYMQRAALIISFNGRSFDLPVLRNRAMVNRIVLPLDRPHLDLLPWCRRHFRARLPDCRLGTIERELIGFRRQDDLPGAEAPRVYETYLRNGKFCEMNRLLEHNRHDIATLLPLLLRLTHHVIDPLEWGEDADELLATGTYQLDHGNLALGEACLKRALEISRWPATQRRALVLLAGYYRRQQRKAAAAEVWERYRQAFPRCQLGWVELAKHHEHTTKDFQRALALVEAAPQSECAELQRRRDRLRRRVARTRGIW